MNLMLLICCYKSVIGKEIDCELRFTNSKNIFNVREELPSEWSYAALFGRVWGFNR